MTARFIFTVRSGRFFGVNKQADMHMPACCYIAVPYDGLLLVRLDFIEALAAINRATLARFERNFRVPAAFRANRGEHLTSSETASAAAHPFRFTGLTTGRTPFGLVRVTLRLKEFLFRSAEGEARTATRTLECFILETQRITSFHQ